MNILLVVHQFFPDYAAGTEVLTLSVARELGARGHTVRVLTGFPGAADLADAQRCDEYIHEGIPVYRFHHAYVPMGGQTSMIEVGFDNRLAAAYFARILRDFEPDLVHLFHLNRLGTGLIDIAADAGVPCFMTPTDFWPICATGQLLYENGSLCAGPNANAGNCVKHFAQSTLGGWAGAVAGAIPVAGADLLVRMTRSGLLPSYPKRQEVVAMASRLGINIARLNRLDGLLVPNAFMRELLLRYGVTPERIALAPFGLDRVAQAAPRPAARAPLRLGFIGTLAPHKGCHVLVDAFNALPAGAATLDIYGKLDDAPDYVATLVAAAAANPAIAFRGTFPNTEIDRVMAGIDALVVPSLWYENTPLVVYSAQAACCPVVGSDLPGIAAVIAHDDNGLLFEAGNVRALARQLARLVDEPGLAGALSAQARAPKSIAEYVDDLTGMWLRRRAAQRS